MVVKNGIFSGPSTYSSTAVTVSVLPEGYDMVLDVFCPAVKVRDRMKEGDQQRIL